MPENQGQNLALIVSYVLYFRAKALAAFLSHILSIWFAHITHRNRFIVNHFFTQVNVRMVDNFEIICRCVTGVE